MSARHLPQTICCDHVGFQRGLRRPNKFVSCAAFPSPLASSWWVHGSWFMHIIPPRRQPELPYKIQRLLLKASICSWQIILIWGHQFGAMHNSYLNKLMNSDSPCWYYLAAAKPFPHHHSKNRVPPLSYSLSSSSRLITVFSSLCHRVRQNRKKSTQKGSFLTKVSSHLS